MALPPRPAPMAVKNSLRRFLRVDPLEDRTVPAAWLVQFDSLAGDYRETQLADATQRFANAGLTDQGLQVREHSGTSGIVIIGSPDGLTETGLEQMLAKAVRARAKGNRNPLSRGRFGLPLPLHWLSPGDLLLVRLRRRRGLVRETSIYVLTKPADN